MFKITRTDDGKTWEVGEYRFLVFENGRGKELINKPEIGTALMLPPFAPNFLWLTSPITEIIDGYNFKTQNSEYKIDKL